MQAPGREHFYPNSQASKRGVFVGPNSVDNIADLVFVKNVMNASKEGSIPQLILSYFPSPTT